MSTLEKFTELTGKWQGQNSLWLAPENPAQESGTTLSITPAVKKKFIEIKYSWAYEDKHQEGLLILGYETERQLTTAVWADSWHMGEKFMQLQGVIKENGCVDLRGHYPAPPGPDWGWRIVVELDGEKTLNLIMYNISPEGEEELAVKAVYGRIEE